MTPAITELVKSMSSVTLGWALGIGSALIIERRKKRRKAKAIQIAVSMELREVAHRLLGIAYKIEARLGGVNRELLEWMLPQIQRYAGPNPRDSLLASVGGLLQATDADLAKLAAYEQAHTPPQFLPQQEASYATAVATEAHDFDPDYAVRLLDILSHIRMFNDTRESCLFYTRLTFTPGMTDENHRTLIQNVDAAD